ncbi:MAG TPA: tRNA (guanosine(46)-N7)-methyltransferase TrmB [Ruminococcaceae bacterium]|nr:tRNA (guanosine(46)-N7)-methyltransferase TrmB [Oscillospiraceae bacterium]
MRMRRKKNLDERIEACREVMLYMQCQNEHANDPLSEEFFADSRKTFGNDNPIFLEIGCGKGGFAIEFARQNPDINLVAVEKTPNVLITGMEEQMKLKLPNLKFCMGQAEYLEHIFHDNTIDRIFLNFSCPFPKKSYAIHRLTHARFLEIYRKIMKENAEIHQKTDNMHFFEFSLEQLSNNGFPLKNVSLDLHNSGFQGNIMTEYEKRFTELGQPIYRLEAVNRRDF